MTSYERVIEALEWPDAYPERPAAVEHIQTHISHLFLTPDCVYKVKKPVDFGFLDFTTLEKRRRFCELELELNRRISPDVYLGVEEVRREAGGRINLEGRGEPVEPALKMRRLPADRAMDRLLPENGVTAEMVRELARLVAGFHQKAATNPDVAGYGSPEVVGGMVDENFRQTEGYVGRTISRTKYRALQAYSNRFLQDQRALLERRAAQGYVRDCHGDLHCSQVFFTDQGVRIIDCIEFTERFRYADVISDMAFMAMDLDHYGRHDLSREFVAAWQGETGDPDTALLLDFYRVYRAYVRGKVESFRLNDPHIPEPEREKAAKRAREYFNLAFYYTSVLPKPRLLLSGGLIGTGKSTIGRYTAADIGAALVSSDAVRKRLSGVPATQRHYDAYGAGLYSPELSRRTYEEMLRLAEDLLREGRSVVLDATFGRRAQREAVLALAQRTGAEFWGIECISDEAEVRERLERRMQRGGSVSDGRWEIYQRERQDFEPFEDVPPSRHVVVDTSRGSVAESVRSVLQRLGEDPE